MTARTIAALLLVAILTTGCRGRWVEATDDARCPGGRINTEKRITDVFPTAGRTRNTTIRTDTCLD